MNPERLSQFREALVLRRRTLHDWLEREPGSRRDLHLGPLGRGDAERLLDKHDQALERIQDGAFGVCRVCQGEVEADLLELDFTTDVCLDDMSREQKGLLERDLELAAKVQKQLLPQRLPEVPGLQLAAHTRPAQIVGGDYFDFFAYPDGALGLAVADVMGKGLAASMLMSNLQASLRILGPESPDPAALASRLNGLFRYNLRVVRFISLVLLRVEPASRRVTYCNAGHNPVLRLDANGDPAWLGPTGPAIGLTVDGAYQAADFRAGTGEMLLAYTDGLTEAADSAGREFGTERLAAYARQRRRDPLEALVMGLREEALAFAGGFQDDVTVVGLRFA